MLGLFKPGRLVLAHGLIERFPIRVTAHAPRGPSPEGVWAVLQHACPTQCHQGKNFDSLSLSLLLALFTPTTSKGRMFSSI